MKLTEKIIRSRDFPIELHIEPTNHCNKACEMCPSRERYVVPINPLGYMKWDIYQKIIDECAEYHKFFIINLHKDGEPLLHPEIGNMIKYAKSKGAFVHFATNGILIMDKRDEIINSGLDLLTISTIDATYKDLVSDFMRYKGKGNKPFTQLKIYADQYSGWQYIEKTARKIPEWWQEADNVIFRELHTWTEGRTNQQARCPCLKLWYNPAINWDGGMSLCCVDYKWEGISGYLSDIGGGGFTIKRLWELMSDLRHAHLDGEFYRPCKDCGYSETIEGGKHGS